MAVYAYIRLIEDAAGELCKAEVVQRRAIDFFAGLHGKQIDYYFIEHSFGPEVPLFQRFEGRRMKNMLKPDDVVIALSLDRAFGSKEDAEVTLKQLREDQIDLQLIDFGGSVIHPAISSIATRVLHQFA